MDQKEEVFETSQISGLEETTKYHRHPHHITSKRRLNRVKGQLDAVGRMIDERRYCPEIIQQLRAASSALRGLEQEIMKNHLRGCVQSAFQSKDPVEIENKISEITKLMTYEARRP